MPAPRLQVVPLRTVFADSLCAPEAPSRRSLRNSTAPSDLSTRLRTPSLAPASLHRLRIHPVRLKPPATACSRHPATSPSLNRNVYIRPMSMYIHRRIGMGKHNSCGGQRSIPQGPVWPYHPLFALDISSQLAKSFPCRDSPAVGRSLGRTGQCVRIDARPITMIMS